MTDLTCCASLGNCSSRTDGTHRLSFARVDKKPNLNLAGECDVRVSCSARSVSRETGASGTFSKTADGLFTLVETSVMKKVAAVSTSGLLFEKVFYQEQNDS